MVVRGALVYALVASSAKALVPVRAPAARALGVVSSKAELESFMDSTLNSDGPETMTAESLADYTSLPSGLKYKDLVPGSGASPRDGDEIEVHYAGWYYSPDSTEGVKFDDSRERDADKGLVFEWGIAPIIEGWKIGMLDMQVGGKRSIIVPPSLGYGAVEVKAAGRPPIPPNSELRFELELKNVDNSIIRKMRRGVGDFLRPPGKAYVSAAEKKQIAEGTLERPLIERMFQKDE